MPGEAVERIDVWECRPGFLDVQTADTGLEDWRVS
jgi:hypothetical protein